MLEMLVEGTVLLMDPLAKTCLTSTPSPTDVLEWTAQQAYLQSTGSRGILEFCLTSRQERLELASHDSASRKAVLDDLFSMQSVPAIMDFHRRFVLIQENDASVTPGVSFLCSHVLHVS
jgi:hypothetical protein